MIDFGLGTSRSLVIAFRKGTAQGAVRTVKTVKTVSCATRLLAAASPVLAATSIVCGKA